MLLIEAYMGDNVSLDLSAHAFLQWSTVVNKRPPGQSVKKIDCSINQNCPPDQSIPQIHPLFWCNLNQNLNSAFFFQYIRFLSFSWMIPPSWILLFFIMCNCLVYSQYHVSVKGLHSLVLDIFLYICSP